MPERGSRLLRRSHPHALFRRRSSTSDNNTSQLPPADNDDSSDSTTEVASVLPQNAPTAATTSESRGMIPGIANDDETKTLSSQGQLPGTVAGVESQGAGRNDGGGGGLLSPLRAPLIKRITAEVDPIPAESTADTPPDSTFMVLLERPLSLVLAQKLISTGNRRASIELVDYESRPNPPLSAPFSQEVEQQQPRLQTSNEDDVGAVTSTKMEDADYLASVSPSETSKPIATVSSPVAATLLDTNRGHQDIESTPPPLLFPQIKVRTHGTIDCTAMPDSLVPQTLRSTEDMATLAASEAIARNSQQEAASTLTGNNNHPQTPSFLKKKSATTIGFLSDMKQIWTRKKTPSSPSSSFNVREKRPRASGTTSPPPPLRLSPTRSLSIPARLGSLDSTSHSGPAALRHEHGNSEPVECRSIGVQTLVESSTTTQELVDKATETTTEYPDDRSNSCMLLVETLENKLCNIHTLLKAATDTLSSKKMATEFDRALGQLHAQLLVMVEQSFDLVHDNGNHDSSAGNEESKHAQNEFLHFLETQSRTQVKILEVEVRAGQELLRVHKSQFETERAEMEHEMTSLRVARSEIERMCTELRRDLRLCRTELACHIANATILKREKSKLEERLALVETQRQTHEFALSKLRGEYDDMREVAAQAQMRVEKYKTMTTAGDGRSGDGSVYVGCDNKLNEASATKKPPLDAHRLPKTTQFLRKHQQITHEPPSQPDQAQNKSTVLRGQNHTVESNVVALAELKRKLASDIRHQIETTKVALCEMETCNVSDTNLTIREEEEELQRLQQRLAASSVEMDAAMEDSRRRLEALLQPSLSRSFNVPPASSSNNNESFSHQQYLHLLSGVCNAPAEPNSSNNNAPQPHDVASNSTLSPTEYIGHIDAFYSYDTLDQRHQAREKDALMRRDAQSALYRKWRQDRVHHLLRVAVARHPHTLKQAQQSMQRFQQTLASFHQSQQ
ncbi:hypothetical protein FI667_g3470, partial [Globisporangium splendens]